MNIPVRVHTEDDLPTSRTPTGAWGAGRTGHGHSPPDDMNGSKSPTPDRAGTVRTETTPGSSAGPYRDTLRRPGAGTHHSRPAGATQLRQDTSASQISHESDPGPGQLDALPAASAPLLDITAQQNAAWPTRLSAS
ncbi:hypothetical protein Sliba_79540 [Streptomyces nigrescens]|uniref:Uncharacterized protein n=1 Tax=Streptomyces nigrescens TaxID=1920 RepID=A0A640TZ49_STRNI|nr:hypothetical protein Sliba_79540 [Streptomyces libani subsp. libani]GGV95963.1 hypothetical protein GCM10010500_37520 [Streptomyces libani subsp. libani]